MPVKSKPSNQIHLTRVYDAPIAAVWDAWTDPAQAAKWWGPRGFTITTHSKDLRPGGHWAYTMHGPDGTDWPNKTLYHEVEPHKKLVYDHGGSDDRPPLFRVTVLSPPSRAAPKTQMDMTMALATPKAAEQTRQVIKKHNGNSTWDRLAEYLEKESTGKEQFVINRTFDVPVETMFEMWTDPAHFAKWLAPTGFEMRFVRSDIKPGGTTFWLMSDPAATTKMYGKAHYLDIQRPGRIVYTQQFVDEHEQPSRHPMAPTWPETMLTTVVLTEEGSGRTRVTVTWQVQGPATPEEVQTFVNERPGMTQGWTGSFDKLEAYLAKN